MKDRTQVFVMGSITLLTAVLIISIFAGRLNMETKASEEPVQVEEVQVEEVQPEMVLKEDVFITSDSSYFDDALFIGDSRTVGLCEYGTLKNADYFASTGMSVYKLWNEKLSVEDVGKVSLHELLNIKRDGKIYIMLGINELGYKIEKTIAENEEMIRKIKGQQPEATIYLCANLHVTKTRSDRDELINNKMIDRFNRKLETLTDNKGIYYIDVNKFNFTFFKKNCRKSK